MDVKLVKFTLKYSGSMSDCNEIDLYDVANALVGFQRSLALTTHLVLNGEIITQAPALKLANIRTSPPEEGSWKIGATVFAVCSGLYALGTAPKDTVIGHLISSGYDYVISETMGFHVDYNKTLGQQYEELKQRTNIQPLPQSKFDSLVEKCEPAISSMHRPIVKSETATIAEIGSIVAGRHRNFEHPLTKSTFEYMDVTNRSETAHTVRGLISSYNINTFKGRIFLEGEQRPIPFELGETAKNDRCISLITNSLRLNARLQFAGRGVVRCTCFLNTSASGRLKRLFMIDVAAEDNS